MGIKPTRQQAQERIELTRELLIKGLHNGLMKKVMREKFGPMSARTVANYISRARDAMLAGIGIPREQWRALATERFEAVLRDPKASPMERIRAQEAINKMLGLDAPTRTEISGPNGLAIAVENKVAKAAKNLTDEQLRSVIQMADNLTNGHASIEGGNSGNGSRVAQGAGEPPPH